MWFWHVVAYHQQWGHTTTVVTTGPFTPPFQCTLQRFTDGQAAAKGEVRWQSKRQIPAVRILWVYATGEGVTVAWVSFMLAHISSNHSRANMTQASATWIHNQSPNGLVPILLAHAGIHAATFPLLLLPVCAFPCYSQTFTCSKDIASGQAGFLSNV